MFERRQCRIMLVFAILALHVCKTAEDQVLNVNNNTTFSSIQENLKNDLNNHKKTYKDKMKMTDVAPHSAEFKLNMRNTLAQIRSLPLQNVINGNLSIMLHDKQDRVQRKRHWYYKKLYYFFIQEVDMNNTNDIRQFVLPNESSHLHYKLPVLPFYKIGHTSRKKHINNKTTCDDTTLSETFLKHNRKKREGSDLQRKNLIYKLNLSYTLRKNLVTVFGLMLYDSYNNFTTHLYTTLFLIYNSVRLRQIPLLEIVDIVLSVGAKPIQKQFKVVFQVMQKYSPSYLKTSFNIWLQSIRDDWLYVSTLLNSINNPFNINFLSDIDFKFAKIFPKLKLKSVITDITENHLGNSFNYLISQIRSKELQIDCNLFVNVMLYLPLENFNPEVDEAQKYLKDTLKDEKEDICNEGNNTNKHKQRGPYDIVRLILLNLIQSVTLHPRIKDCAQIIYPFMYPPHVRIEQIDQSNHNDYKDLPKLITSSEFPHDIVDVKNLLIQESMQQAMKQSMQYHYESSWEFLVASLERMRRTVRLTQRLQDSLRALRSHVLLKYHVWQDVQLRVEARSIFHVQLILESLASPNLSDIHHSLYKAITPISCWQQINITEDIRRKLFESTNPRKTAVSIVNIFKPEIKYKRCILSDIDKKFILKALPDILEKSHFNIIKTFLFNISFPEVPGPYCDLSDSITPAQKLTTIIKHILPKNKNLVSNKLYEALVRASALLDFNSRLCLISQENTLHILTEFSECLDKTQYKILEEFLKDAVLLTNLGKALNLCIFLELEQKLQALIENYKQLYKTKFNITLYNSLNTVQNLLKNQNEYKLTQYFRAKLKAQETETICSWQNDSFIKLKTFPNFLGFSKSYNHSVTGSGYVKLIEQLEGLVVSRNQTSIVKQFLKDLYLSELSSNLTNYSSIILELRYIIIRSAISLESVMTIATLHEALKSYENILDKLVQDKLPATAIIYPKHQDMMLIEPIFPVDPNLTKIFEQPLDTSFTVAHILSSNNMTVRSSLFPEKTTTIFAEESTSEPIATTFTSPDIQSIVELLENLDVEEDYLDVITDFLTNEQLETNLGPACNLSHYLLPFFKLKAIIKQAKTLEEVQNNEDLRKAVDFYNIIIENDSNENKLYLISQFLGDEYMIESFGYTISLSDFSTPKLQLQAILDSAMSMNDLHADVQNALDDFNRTLNNEANYTLSPFPNFIQVIERIPYVPNADVHLPAFVSFLTNPYSLGINFNISQYPTPITKLFAIIKDARESKRLSEEVLEAALDKYEKALFVIMQNAPDEFILEEPVYTTNDEKLFHVRKFLTNPKLFEILMPISGSHNLNTPIMKLQQIVRQALGLESTQLYPPLYDGLENFMNCLDSKMVEENTLQLNIPTQDFINLMNMLPNISKAEISLPTIAGFLINPSFLQITHNLSIYPSAIHKLKATIKFAKYSGNIKIHEKLTEALNLYNKALTATKN